MSYEQLELMLAASRLGRWQRKVAQSAVLEMFKTGSLSPSPEGISDPRWRGMVVRMLMDHKSGPPASAVD